MHLLIPQRAVNEMQGMFQVFAVGDSNKLSLKLIKIGPQYNMSYIVEEGLATGRQNSHWWYSDAAKRHDY